MCRVENAKNIAAEGRWYDDAIAVQDGAVRYAQRFAVRPEGGNPIVGVAGCGWEAFFDGVQ